MAAHGACGEKHLASHGGGSLASKQAGEDLVLLRREMLESRQGRMFWQAVVHPGHPGSRDLLSDVPEVSLQLRDPIGSQTLDGGTRAEGKRERVGRRT